MPQTQIVSQLPEKELQEYPQPQQQVQSQLSKVSKVSKISQSSQALQASQVSQKLEMEDKLNFEINEAKNRLKRALTDEEKQSKTVKQCEEKLKL